MSENDFIKELNSRHRLIMADMVLQGMNNAELAQKHGISVVRLNQLKQSPLWKKEADKMRQEFLGKYKAQMESMIPQAITALQEAMSHGYRPKIDNCTGNFAPVINPPSTRVAAAEKLLDRVGLGAKHDTGQNNRAVTIQMYIPGWGSDDGRGKVRDIEVELSDNKLRR